MKITDKYVFFYRGWPSNFTRSFFYFGYSLVEQPNDFFCSEQAFMYCKARYFRDIETAVQILDALLPEEAKALGRQVKNYNDSEWSKVRYNFMRSVNLYKYKQDWRLRKLLLNPEYDGKTFVEASPVDYIWGVGLDETDPKIENSVNWKGQNLLGQVLTEVRNILKTDSVNYII